jgi:hypothetical protein
MSAGGGAIIPPIAGAALVGIGTIRTYTTEQSLIQNASNPWRPPQWAKPALTSITVPAPYVQAPATGSTTPITAGGSTAQEQADANGGFIMTVNTKLPPPPPNASPITYVFDATFRIGHSQEAVPTQNPIQTGANSTDHVRLDPARIVLEIGMSDAMQSYISGQFTGNSSRSVSAFQVLDALRAQRIPLTVTTRLKTYTNMIITNIPVQDTVRTRWGLRTPVYFQQIFVSNVATLTVSARPQTTGETSIGQQNPTPPTAGEIQNNMLPSTTTGAPTPAAIEAVHGIVPGAGNWSSNNTSDLAGLATVAP